MPQHHRALTWRSLANTLIIGLTTLLNAVLPGQAATGAQPQRAPSIGFQASNYHPAILRLSFTTATDQTSPGFLDITLVPSRGELRGYRADTTTESFSALLKALYGQLARQEDLRVDDPQAPARKLYDLMIRPVISDLRHAGITTLLISADAGLQAVPFAALHDGERYLGETTAFSITPSLGLTLRATDQLFRPQSRLAAGASRFPNLAPLPLVPQELNAVAASGTNLATTSAQTFLNERFTPSLLTRNATESSITQLHVATHAEFMPGGPSQSRLYTGTEPMTLADFAQLRHRRQGAPLELLSLSACRTALGDRESELGFAGLALQAGARSAIGSLWYVDDVATTAYFVQFYRYLDAGYPKAEAMQMVRRSMAGGKIRLEGDRLIGASNETLVQNLSGEQRRRVQNGLRHPYFWSGIELTGTPW